MEMTKNINEVWDSIGVDHRTGLLRNCSALNGLDSYEIALIGAVRDFNTVKVLLGVCLQTTYQILSAINHLRRELDLLIGKTINLF